MKRILGNMFDLNHDGKMSLLEIVFINEMMRDELEAKTELELSGLDPDELEFMDADERREALEGAGLDPGEYDF